MPIRNAIASIPVASLSQSLAWYSRLFGRAPDSRPMDSLAEWRFEHGGWLQVFEAGDERVGHGSVTLAVSDLDEQRAALQALGIDPGAEIGGPGVRVVMLKDPDGNSLAFAQAIDPSFAK